MELLDWRPSNVPEKARDQVHPAYPAQRPDESRLYCNSTHCRRWVGLRAPIDSSSRMLDFEKNGKAKRCVKDKDLERTYPSILLKIPISIPYPRQLCPGRAYGQRRLGVEVLEVESAHILTPVVSSPFSLSSPSLYTGSPTCII